MKPTRCTLREPVAADALLDLVALGPDPPITMCSCVRPRSRRRGVEQRVEPVAVEEAAHGERDERVGGETEARGGSPARRAGDRREPLDVGSEVHHRDRARPGQALEVAAGELADRDEPVGRARRCTARSSRRRLAARGRARIGIRCRGCSGSARTASRSVRAACGGRDRAHEGVCVREHDVGVAGEPRHTANTRGE